MLTIILVILGITSRLVVHTPQFTALLAVTFFGGMYLKGKQALWMPLVVMAVSDLFLGFHDTMFFTWGSIALISCLGFYLRNRKSWMSVLGGSVAASVIFFVITNFGAWLSPLYPHTLAGLQSCYINAIPFYRTTLTSTVVFSMLLYVSYEYLLARRDNPVLAKLLA